jgi:hypothetical protein
MASKAKRTTMAKITRENRVRERRLEKEAKKAARKLAAAADQPRPGDEPAAQDAPERDQ